MPNPVIKPSQQLSKYLKDLYTGEVLSPAERNFQNFMQPAAAFANFIKNPIDPETGFPNMDIAGPVMTGITGARNAKRIRDEIAALNLGSQAEIAIEFIKRKYPRLASSIQKYYTSNVPLMDKITGEYNPLNQTAKIFTSKGKNISDYGQAAAHETFHGVQDIFQNRKQELLPPEMGGTYKYVKNPIEYSTLEDYLRAVAEYQNQPVEAEAFKAGITARKAIENYFKRLSGK